MWRRSLWHRPKHLKIVDAPFSSFQKYNNFRVSFLFAVPFGFSTKLFASSPNPIKNFEPNDSKLRSSECLKNAAGLSVDSTSAVLSQTVYAIIRIEQQYIELIDVLIKLLEYQLQVLKHKSEVERIEDIVLETRQEIKNVYQRKQDLTLLFSSVEKLAEATAEVAFAAGVDYASTSAGERLHSAQREVQRVQALSQKAEKELLQVEANVITEVTKHNEKMKKKEVAQEDMNKNNSNESQSFKETDEDNHKNNKN